VKSIGSEAVSGNSGKREKGKMGMKLNSKASFAAPNMRAAQERCFLGSCAAHPIIVVSTHSLTTGAHTYSHFNFSQHFYSHF